MHDIKEHNIIFTFRFPESHREIAGPRRRRDPRRGRESAFIPSTRDTERERSIAVAVEEAQRETESPSVERFREID